MYQNPHDREYLRLVNNVMVLGETRQDRTGVGTKSIFGAQCRYDLREGFPLLTSKFVNFDSVAAELVWFIAGKTNTNDIKPPTKIWDDWADADGNLGPIYGHQFRKWTSAEGPIDQLAWLIEAIKIAPFSRRLIVSAWNVGDLSKMKLQPCHTLFQINVSSQAKLDGRHYIDLQLYQRSADLALGVPYNIASYSLLLHMIAKDTNTVPRYFIHSIGDAHIYSNHVDGLKEQMGNPHFEPGRLVLPRRKDIFETEVKDICLEDYCSNPPIKFKVAV